MTEVEKLVQGFLPGGAQLIVVREGTFPVVLAKWKGEFVTWFVNPSDRAVYSGHYFTDILDAAKDFSTRE